MCVCVCVSVCVCPTPHEYYGTQFLSGVQLVLIQSFPSPRLVASPKLNNLVYRTIHHN